MSQTVPNQEVAPELQKKTPEQVEKPTEVSSEKRVESSGEPSKAAEAGLEPVITRGTDGRLRGELCMGGAHAVVEPLVVETFIGQRSNEMMEAGKAVAEGASRQIQEGDTEGAQALMEQQIQEQHMESDGTFTLSEAIREIPNVYAIEPGGFDTSKLGNKMNFSSDMMFGINPAEAEHMLDLLQHPKSGVGEFGATFALKKNSPLDIKTEGMEVTFQDKDGVKKEIMFLYLNMKQKETPAENTKQEVPVAESTEAGGIAEKKEVPVTDSKKDGEEVIKPVEEMAGSSENGTDTDSDQDKSLEDADSSVEKDSVAASADTLTTGKKNDTVDHNKSVSKVVSINTGSKKPKTNSTQPTSVSSLGENEENFSKAA